VRVDEPFHSVILHLYTCLGYARISFNFFFGLGGWASWWSVDDYSLRLPVLCGVVIEGIESITIVLSCTTYE
jgi:hypothetical protein